MATNKNSVYVQSLVDFLKDTKPYHSKLTEVIEEYRFSDEMTVHFDERLYTSMMAKAAWMYSFFSGGSSIQQQMNMHQLVAPNLRVTEHVAGTDENTDLPLVPRAFSPVAIEGPGMARALFKRANGVQEPVLEGHDVYQSHGAYTFQVYQTVSTRPTVVGHFEQSYTATDAPFPKLVTLPFSNAAQLIITGPAVQVTLDTISVTGVGNVHVDGISDSTPYSPLFAEKRNEGLLAHASGAVQAFALDESNPASAISKVNALLAQIESHLTLYPNAAASIELMALQAIVASNNIPSTYEALLNALVFGGTPPLAGYPGWVVDLDTWSTPYLPYVNQVLESYSTSLYFNAYTDVAARESGALKYDDVYRDDLVITQIAADPLRAEYEEWSIEVATSTSFIVRGSATGVVGVVQFPGVFTSPQLSFKIEQPAPIVPVTPGDVITLTPASKITIHAAAPLEAWSLIKVNPSAYTRPVLSSTRYGYVMSSTGQRDFITVLDTPEGRALPTGTIILTATSSTQFTLTSSADPLYTANVPVNTAFNDGKLAFTIVAGSAYAFEAGDRFYIELLNAAPVAEDLDLYYGYDMGPYSGGDGELESVYSSLISNPDYGLPLDFNWDSRFVSYDLASFNLQLSQSAVSGRQWRLRAEITGSEPELQNSVPTNLFNQLSSNDPLNPNAPQQFDTPSNQTAEGPRSEIDGDSQADLRLWYAQSFILEYLDGTSWVQVDQVIVGDTYTNPTHGLSFTLVPGSKPFIASRLVTTQYNGSNVLQTTSVDGGDIISWTVLNDPPIQQGPAGLTSVNVPHLWIHGDSYHASTPAQWTLTWTGNAAYRVQGIYTTGPQNGQLVYPAPGLTISMADGNSFKNDTHGLHWTLYNGVAGLASGDSITFNTLPERPSYLVYGSVSGWQPDATVGEWYWNGKIGFKLPTPVPRLFEANTWVKDWTSSLGPVVLESLRFDAPSMVYTARSHVNGHWTLYRDGKVVAEGESTLRDKYVHLTMPTAVAGTALVIDVQGEAYALPVGNDLIIVRSSPGRTLNTGDSLVLYRAEYDDIQVSIKPKDSAHSIALQPLGQQTIDLRFVDLNALSGVPLSNTSPETAVLQGWIPLLQERYDGTTEAVYSDAQTKVVLRAAGTGETIGTIESLGVNPAESVVLKWDQDFAAAYLPLNAEATVVTLGSGLDEHMNVNVTEGIMFLMSGGGAENSAMFADEMNVNIIDTELLGTSALQTAPWRFKIAATYTESSSVSISDGPFNGFMPGYDNMPYDAETANGYYDAGHPLSDEFMRAQTLAALVAPTQAEQDELQTLLAVLDPYLDGNDLTNTTFAEFVQALGNTTIVPPATVAIGHPVNYTPVTYPVLNTPLEWKNPLLPRMGFGTPGVGMGMSINQDSTSVAGASVVEAITILANDTAFSYDNYGFDVGPLDVSAEMTAVVMVSGSFPLAVKAASTASRALSGLTSVDGVVLATGDLVLLKNQTNPAENGIWVAAAGAWARPTAYDSPAELPFGLEVQVLNGTMHAGTVWAISAAPAVVNVDPIQFSTVGYNDFDTPLASLGGRIIDISLTFNYTGTPTVFVWLPADSAARRALVQQVSARLFRISLPSSSEFKLIAG